LTFGFGFCSVLYGVGFGSVLGKTWVLVRFVLAGFEFVWLTTRAAIVASARHV